MTDFDARAISTIRGLAMDAPHAARSGHQGTAMALAPLAHVLYTRVMNYDAARADWVDRDRFVLSAGSRVRSSRLWTTALRRRNSGRRLLWNSPLAICAARSGRKRSLNFLPRYHGVFTSAIVWSGVIDGALLCGLPLSTQSPVVAGLAGHNSVCAPVVDTQSKCVSPSH